MKIPGKSLSSHLSAYLEGDLPEAKREQLERELEHDPKLRAELEAISNLRKVLRKFPDPELPSGMHSRIVSKVTEKTERMEWVKNFFQHSPLRAPLSAIVCGFVLVAFFSGTDLLDIMQNDTRITTDQNSAPYKTPQQQLIPGVNRVRAGGMTSERNVVRSLSTPKRSVPHAKPAATLCRTVNSASNPSCKERFEKWLNLAQRNQRRFRAELHALPINARDQWLSELTAYAKATGKKFSSRRFLLAADGDFR
jgi:ferric-dicitrate binding protein FerR (iron transport regulator)